MATTNPNLDPMAAYPSTVVPIPEERHDERGWKLFINRQLHAGTISSLDLVNLKYGRVSYGDDPSHKFDGICLAEPGGDGQQILPFAIIEGKLYVGVVLEWRRNHGAEILNAPRGWKDPQLSHLASALQESQEEMGVEAEGIFPTGGEPVNFNSAWAVTFGSDGFEFFVFEVATGELTAASEGNIVFKGSKAPIQGAGEKIGKCRFIPWHEAMLLKDMFTVAGVGRLMTWLISHGRGDVLKF